MRFGRSIPAGFTLLFSAALSLNAAPMHPVEQRLRDQFPSVPLQASATFDAAEEMVGRSVVSGLRAHFAQASAGPNLPGVAESMALVVGAAETNLQVTYPRFYGDPLVAALGEQRVVLRAVNARGAVAEAANGKLIYQQPYGSVDAVQVPSTGRSEELLLLRDDGAPLVYEYEIVEMSGVSAVVMDGGAVRFLSNASEIPSTTQIASGRFTQLPRMLQIDRPWVIDAAGRRSEVHAKWTVISDGKTPKTLRLTVSGKGLAYPLVVDPSFSATGSLATARFYHSATLLPNGKVLIAGGYNAGYLTSAELYDPTSGTFSATGSLGAARYGHTATLLPNGKVLIAGGSPNGTSAELYDPASGTFSATGSLTTARSFPTATLLPNGKVLLAGGYTSSAELYDPASGTFSATGSMSSARAWHTATLLPNGKVLVAGGAGGGLYLSSAELYNPASGTFSATGSLATGRWIHTATLLPNGNVLIVGGYNGTSPYYLNSAELYSPASGTFSATGSLADARDYHSAMLLPNGKVLIVGGGNNTTHLNSAELYDPAGGTFTATGSLATGRAFATATVLPGGRVLIAGGVGNGGILSSAEMYDSASGAFTATGSLATARRYHTATLLPNGKVLIAGGFTTSAEIYDPASGTFSATGNLGTSRYAHTATLLPNGKVLIAGGFTTSAEIYDPASGTFSATGSLSTVRGNHSATLLPNGKVLIAGGSGLSSFPTTAELYDPATGTFSVTGSSTYAFEYHTATLLPNGKVLIAGGYITVSLHYAELYDPESGTFSATGSLPEDRYHHAAMLLPNGKVLIAGGEGTIGWMNSALLYDPASGTFSATGSLGTARSTPTATLLSNGKVLIAAGSGPPTGTLSSAELYDPASGTFSTTGSLAVPRNYHTATLLPNQKVLIAAGSADGVSAELYDAGLGYADARRPVVLSSPSTLAQPASFAFYGSGFRGDSEASGGSFNSSPTNFPLLQLQRVDNDQTVFVGPGSAWSDISFTSTTLSALANGPYRATLFTNAIPSIQRIILVSGMAAPGAPTLFTATATGFSTVSLTWRPVAEAAGYEVYRSSFNGPYTLALTTSASSATDSGLSANTTYLYQVRTLGSGGPSAFTAIDPATTIVFTDTSLSGVLIKAVHIDELRTAVNAMQVAAGLSPSTFTDPTLTAGTTTIKRLHVTELRDALDAARSTIGLPVISYTDATITPGFRVI
jgi:uncharacterized delta-60 repeat protein